MTKTHTIGPYKFKMDEYLSSNLDIILHEAIPNKWDCVGIIFGKEGTGKSTIASQICKYLDHNFCLNTVVFTPNQFITACNEAPEESAILWDEAITGANIQNHASTISQSIISMLTQIRKKRLKIILCFPYLNMLNKYFISRCLFSIYVYSKGFIDRGHLFFYNQTQTEFLYNLIKQKYKYNYQGAIQRAKHAFYCNYDGTLCLPNGEYNDKKESSRLDDGDVDKKQKIWKDRLGLAITLLRENGLTLDQIGNRIGMDRSDVGKLGRGKCQP